MHAVVAEPRTRSQRWREYVSDVLTAGPDAVAAAKALIADVLRPVAGAGASTCTADAIASARVSPEGQEGMRGVPREAEAVAGRRTRVDPRALLIANRGEIALRDHSRLPRDGYRDASRSTRMPTRMRAHVRAADRAVADRSGRRAPRAT